MTNTFFRLHAAFVLAIALCANAQEANRAEPSSGPREGIKVHGHWTIEVRNPDGKLVTHREFENSLITNAPLAGPVTLSTALGRASTIGLWFVYVLFATNSGGPCLLGNTAAPCIAVESADPITGPGYFHTLTLSAPFNQSDPNYRKLTLNGNVPVQNAGQISRVETFVGGCAPTVAPASCMQEPGNLRFNQLGLEGFTLSSFTPIPVSVGQLVLFTVVFSFS
jgi:hypothetical protein